MLRQQPPSHLPRHLLLAVLAYRLQADELGDLHPATARLLKQIAASGGIREASRRTDEFSRRRAELKPGTILMREWNAQTHRVMVVDEGFAWNGKTYDSLSKVAFAITGTRWNGPGSSVLRDVTAPVRATTIRNVCAQLINDRQSKELPHSEMSRVERGPQVASAIRHSRWNAQSGLNCPDRALSRPSRATAGSTMRNTKLVSEASEHKIENSRNETAESKVRDPDRLV